MDKISFVAHDFVNLVDDEEDVGDANSDLGDHEADFDDEPALGSEDDFAHFWVVTYLGVLVDFAGHLEFHGVKI